LVFEIYIPSQTKNSVLYIFQPKKTNMAKEYETKVLEINANKIRKKLKKMGAKKIFNKVMRRWVFDLNIKGGDWIRVRDTGHHVTLTYKCRKKGKRIDNTEEIEVHVSNFEDVVRILSKLKFRGCYYQENRREMYKLDGIEFCIDTWPKIPTYLEVESANEKKVKQGLKMLGLDGKDIGNISVWDVYSKYGIDLHSFKNLCF